MSKTYYRPLVQHLLKSYVLETYPSEYWTEILRIIDGGSKSRIFVEYDWGKKGYLVYADKSHGHRIICELPELHMARDLCELMGWDFTIYGLEDDENREDDDDDHN